MNTITPKEILNLALSIQDKGIGQVVVTYSGHVDSMSISIYKPEWKEEGDNNLFYYAHFYLEGSLRSIEKINNTIRDLNNINDGAYITK